MQRTMMRAKVHGATVTECNLQYEGSLALDTRIMEELDILPNEMVQVLNVNNGARLTTYIIPGERDSGAVSLNGAAARMAAVGDKVLLIFYVLMSEDEARTHRPKVALVDEQNRITEVLQPAEPPLTPGMRKR